MHLGAKDGDLLQTEDSINEPLKPCKMSHWKLEVSADLIN